MREIDKVLDTNEQVFWEGNPKFWPYFLTGVIPTFLFGLVWLGFLAPFIAVNFLPKGNTGEATGFINIFFFAWNIFLIPFLLLSLWMLVGVHIYKWLLYKHLHYAITNKRVIIQKGVIGRDFEYIDFDQITNAEVSVGFWDKVVGKTSGSILIYSAGSFTVMPQGQQVAKPYTISNIDNPYDVFKFFKEVSHDIKTDIEYPNKLRPGENPGYQSNYDPNKK